MSNLFNELIVVCMKANELSVKDFISKNEHQFIIPVYQRNYDWKQEQCNQLFKDIVEVGNGDENLHFIGSIVYITDSVYSTNDIKELVIIDGQQRLTTITLIYIALYHFIKDVIKDKKASAQIYETYLINKFAEESRKIKLKSNDSSNEAIQHLIESSDVSALDTISKVKENYLFFSQRINEKNYKVIQEGLNKLFFVEIILTRDNDNPQRIFESLNSTGLSLSQADLIRNYILMGLEQQEQNTVFRQYWAVIEKNSKLIDKNESKVSDFIRDYLTLTTASIPKIGDVYQVFKKRYPDLTNDKDKLYEVLEKLKIYSEQYYKLINPLQEPDLDIRKRIININYIEVNVAYPFLIQVFLDYKHKKIDKANLLKVLDLIESFVIRRFITELPTNSLNKIFMSLYSKIELDNYVASMAKALLLKTGNESFPRDEEVKEKLKTKDLYNSKIKSKNYILQKMEEYNNPEPVIIKDNKEITIEHIFPQKPCEEWKDDISAEDYNLLQNKYLHTIGNLSLTGGNQRLGNARFIDKRDKKDYGYRDSRMWLNKSLQNFDKWGMEEFNTRFEVIAQRFIDVWPQPKERVSKDVDLVNIFDAEDPRRKNLETVMFMGQEIKKNNITEYYVEIIRRLFEKNADYFFSSSLANIVKLTRINEKVNLRQAASISNEYCIETSLNSSTKFIKLKEALEYFGLEDELFIKYKANEESEEDE